MDWGTERRRAGIVGEKGKMTFIGYAGRCGQRGWSFWMVLVLFGLGSSLLGQTPAALPAQGAGPEFEAATVKPVMNPDPNRAHGLRRTERVVLRPASRCRLIPLKRRAGRELPGNRENQTRE
jgi:hypothetical protein